MKKLLYYFMEDFQVILAYTFSAFFITVFGMFVYYGNINYNHDEPKNQIEGYKYINHNDVPVLYEIWSDGTLVEVK